MDMKMGRMIIQGTKEDWFLENGIKDWDKRTFTGEEP